MKKKTSETEVDMLEQAREKLRESLEGAYNPRHPIHAIIDHLKGIKSSHALSYFTSPEDAVGLFIQDYGTENLREYLHDSGHDDLIDKKMNDVLRSIRLIATMRDHNSQSYINFHDNLNKLSVEE
jgi:hypothetical protein